MAITPVGTTDLALDRPVTVSSASNESGLPAYAVNDGNDSSRWESNVDDNEWLYIDLGQTHAVNEVKLNWYHAAANFQVQVSNDASTWMTIDTVTGNSANIEDLTGLSGSGRYLRILGTARASTWSYALQTINVYGT